MTKVLPGTSRQVLAFIRTAWTDLLQVSLVPMMVVAGVAMLQFSVMAKMFEGVIGFESGAQINPAQFGRIMQFYGIVMLLGLFSLLMMIWLYVRIVRLYGLGEKYWIGLNGSTLKAVLMTLVYGVGIYFLMMAAYLACVIAVVIPVAIVGATFAGSGADGAAAALIIVPAILAIFAFLIWFSTRFLVGLPSVALGQSPGLFDGMWSLSKGESWGVPLRVVLSTLVLVAVLMLLFAVLLWPVFAEFANQIKNFKGGQLPNSFIVDQFWPAMRFQVIFLLVQVPWIWFTVLLYAEANRRFSNRAQSS